VYEEREFPPKLGKKWRPVDLEKVAWSVGKTSRRSCGACHLSGGGGGASLHIDLSCQLR